MISLKDKVIDKIQNLETDYVLEEILHLLEFEEDEAVYNLSEEQKNAAEHSRNEIASGNFYTNQQVEKEIDIWLKE